LPTVRGVVSADGFIADASLIAKHREVDRGVYRRLLDVRVTKRL
jgi:hypothetical protein